MSSTSDLDKSLAPLLGAETIITKPIASLSVIFFIYGIYCVIFGLSIHTLFQHNSSAHRLHKGCSTALFVLATIYVAVYTWGISRQTFIEFQAATTKDYTVFNTFSAGDDQKSAVVAITWFISTFMNSIADLVLIHRCCIVWNSNRFILCPLAFAAVVLNGIDFGYNIAYMTGYGDSSKPINTAFLAKIYPIDKGVVIGIAAFQIVLTFLIGGRIWWIAHEARQLADNKSTLSITRFDDIVAIIIESALLYAASLLTGVLLQDVAWDPNVTSVQPINFPSISTLMSGVAPTMVIVRVAYGKSIDSVHQLSTFRIADAQASQQRTAAMIRQDNLNLQLHSNLGSSDLQEDSEEHSANSVPAEKV